MFSYAAEAFSSQQKISINSLLDAADRLFEWEFERLEVLSTSRNVGFQWQATEGLSLVHGVLPALSISGQSRAMSANEIVCCYTVSTACQFSNRSGDKVQLKPHQFTVQQFTSDCNWEINQPFQYTMLCISREIFNQYVPNFPIAEGVQIPSAHGLNELLSRLLNTAWSIARVGQLESAAPGLLRSLSELLSISLAMRKDQLKYDAHKSAGRWHSQAQELITKHYCMPSFGTGYIAQNLNISPRYLQQIFAENGSSVSEEIREYRLKESAHLLTADETTDLSLTDIALRCGFGSSSRFSAEFKRRFGISPMRYRNMRTNS